MTKLPISHAYAIESPSGYIMACTTARTKGESFSLLWDNMDDAFRSKYWKRKAASMAAYRRAGYRCRKVIVCAIRNNALRTAPNAGDEKRA